MKPEEVNKSITLGKLKLAEQLLSLEDSKSESFAPFGEAVYASLKDLIVDLKGEEYLKELLRDLRK